MRAAALCGCCHAAPHVTGLAPAPAGIVRFERPKPVDEVLNDWAADVGEVLKLIERTDHLIAKERQVHAVRD